MQQVVREYREAKSAGGVPGMHVGPGGSLIGDGSPIPQADVDLLRALLWRHTSAWPLQSGDVLVVHWPAFSERNDWEVSDLRFLRLSIKTFARF